MRVEPRFESLKDDRQRTLARLLCDPSDKRTFALKCDAARVQPDEVLDWYTDPEFLSALQGYRRSFAWDAFHEVFKAHVKQAAKGDVRAVVAYYEKLLDVGATQKVDLTTGGKPMSIQIVGESKTAGGLLDLLGER